MLTTKVIVYIQTQENICVKNTPDSLKWNEVTFCLIIHNRNLSQQYKLIKIFATTCCLIQFRKIFVVMLKVLKC